MRVDASIHTTLPSSYEASTEDVGCAGCIWEVIEDVDRSGVQNIGLCVVDKESKAHVDQTETH